VSPERLIDFWCLTHFLQYFSYIVSVSFIVGGNRRKPPTCHKFYHKILYRVHPHINRYYYMYKCIMTSRSFQNMIHYQNQEALSDFQIIKHSNVFFSCTSKSSNQIAQFLTCSDPMKTPNE
jgi:hypothetical protein